MGNWDDEKRKFNPAGGGSRPGGGRPDQRRDDAPPQPEPRPDGGYFEEKDPDRPLKLWYLEPRTTRGLAYQFVNDRPALTRSQLRRFFNHCTMIRRRLNADTNLRWEKVRGSFLMLASHAAEAKDKDRGKIPLVFYQFITDHVERVKTREDFLRGFMPHFEAIVGFSALYIER
jgi:CRISPR type III-A-associated protein Csm2